MSPAYTLVPFFLMIFLAIFSGVVRNDSTIRFVVISACEEGIKKSIFKGITVKELRAACAENYLYNLFDQLMWTVIRTAFQVCGHDI